MTRVLRSPLVGAVLLVLFGGWAMFSHPSAPQAVGWAASCAVLAGGLLMGAGLGRIEPAIPGGAALAIAVGAVVLTAPASLSGDPTAPPLGYMNANGALLLAGAAGAVVASGTRPLPWRLGAAVVSLVLAGLCLVDGAQTAAVACLAVTVWALLRGEGPAWAWRAAGVVTVAVPPLFTVAWATEVVPRPGFLVSALSPERFTLWADAVEALGDHPVAGVGPGLFSSVSPTAADPDLAWAHSVLLQTAAELGWVGVALLVLFVAWALLALGRDGVLLGILLLPASIDYVLHFGGVLLVSSLVLGGGVGSAVVSSSRRSGTGKP